MSVPIVGWNPHWGCVPDALGPHRIPLKLGYGAYWHHAFSNLLEDCVNRVDWFLALDYDSMFRAADVGQLLQRFRDNPHIDALAALQCRRGVEETPILSINGQGSIRMGSEVFAVDTAHFGLTLIRSSALRDVSMPWLMDTPDEKGSYANGKGIDADTFFWKRWKKEGKTVYVDPQCSIGHLQPMIAEFDANFQPIQTHLSDWRSRKQKPLKVASSQPLRVLAMDPTVLSH